MRVRRSLSLAASLFPPALALSAAGFLFLSARSEQVLGYSIQGSGLGLGQRDFRLFNNFFDSQANDNTVPHPNFPGYQGAVMSVWKGAIEWGSELHADGQGDPEQPGGLGSGGANFDPSFQGLATDVGGSDDNIMSAISSCSPGLLAYTVIPTSDGWQIRFCDGAWTWSDGPGTFLGGMKDIQGTAVHEYGHALGLGHSGDPNASMLSGAPGSAVTWRSIESDDIAGVQAIYGAKSATKPRITGLAVSGATLTISGSDFSATDNEVWFTQRGFGGTGDPVKVVGATSDGTTITVTVPANGGPGDVLVKRSGGAFSDLSNAWPFEPGPPCLTGPTPGTVGTVNTITISKATPGGIVAVGFSFDLGSILVGPFCPGVSLGLDNPTLIGATNADVNGTASFSGMLDSSYSGITVHLQGMDTNLCGVTNLVTHVFP